MSFLTGKGGSSESGNKAYGWAKDTFGGAAAGFGNTTNVLGNILGGGPEGAQALDDWWNSSGGQFLLDQGLDATSNKYAAMGLNKSGSAAKAIENYRSGLASTYLNNYLGQLSDLGKLQLGAGGLVVDAGQYSKSKGQSPGLGPTIGSIIGAVAASARELKADIQELGHWDNRGDGLKRYRFRYKNDPSKTFYEGVMADEVKELRPWAYVPNFIGDKPGVNYAALGNAA